jgi:hypothetical protein
MDIVDVINIAGVVILSALLTISVGIGVYYLIKRSRFRRFRGDVTV